MWRKPSIFASDKKQIKTKDYATHCSNDVTRQRSGNKTKLAENLCNTLIETLGVDAKFVSVSVEDVEMKEWENSMRRIPAETIIVNPNKNEYEKVIIDSFVTADRPVDGGLWRR